MVTLIPGDCLKQLKSLQDNSIDSLITDPPAGISFMGKDWDSSKGGRDNWIAWMSEVMRECHRVLKPGAHGLVWAIPRTSHWTATALENAGFEVRDVVTHLFGSGFPKSLDISKAIDKAAGKEREILGLSKFANRGAISSEGSHEGWKRASHQQHTQRVDTIPATSEAKQWQGFGTAIKPSVEKWVLVRKPNLGVDLSVFDELEFSLWSMLNAKTAEKILKLINVTWTVEKGNIVPVNALTQAVDVLASLTETGAVESLREPTDISASEKTVIISLSIVWSWKNILAVLYDRMSTFITSTAISQIIDFQTLSYLASQITPESIIQASNAQNGKPESVQLVAEYLNDCVQRCEGILTLYAHDNAFTGATPNQESLSVSQKIENVIRKGPFSEELVLIRKPCSEKTVAANVLKWGTGGINIDGCRIGTDTISTHGGGDKYAGLKGNGNDGIGEYKTHIGRFPANLLLSHTLFCEHVGEKKVKSNGNWTGIHSGTGMFGNEQQGLVCNDPKVKEDGTETVEAWNCTEDCPVRLLDEQSGHLHGSGNKSDNGIGLDESYDASGYHISYAGRANRDYGSQGGGASRFFYCAKASKRERNEGLEGMPEVEEGIGDPRPSGQSMQRLDGREPRKMQNHHPTVKPQKLMQYLITLITPPNGTVLDPFMGSGSTGVAAKKLGFGFIGIEQNKEYFEISNKRIS